MKFNIIKRTLALAGALMMTFTVAACSGNKQDSSSQSSQSSESQAETTIVDREGNTITAPAKVEKIISMAPSITEVLVSLGMGDKIIAVDKYSVNVEGIPQNLPVFDIMSPDTESIAAMKPDIIFATGMSKAKGDDPFAPITDLGVLMTYIPSAGSIEAIKEDIKFIGAITGTKDAGDKIIGEMESKMSAILEKIKDAPKGATVYFEISQAPSIYTFGTGTFLNEIITMLGATNIFADQENWISASEETVVDKNPDVIFTNVSDAQDAVSEILNRNGWNAINAVKNNRVYLIDRDASSRPNQSVVNAFEQMAKALYPDLF